MNFLLREEENQLKYIYWAVFRYYLLKQYFIPGKIIVYNTKHEFDVVVRFTTFWVSI